jgi:hypothetical protein
MVECENAAAAGNLLVSGEAHFQRTTRLVLRRRRSNLQFSRSAVACNSGEPRIPGFFSARRRGGRHWTVEPSGGERAGTRFKRPELERRLTEGGPSARGGRTPGYVSEAGGGRTVGDSLSHTCTHAQRTPRTGLHRIWAEPTGQTEFLSTSDVAMLRVPGALVIMAGCESGGGEIRAGAGLLG